MIKQKPIQQKIQHKIRNQKHTLKTLRDKCLQDWSLQSRQVPSWLLKQKQNLLNICIDQPVHGLFQSWIQPILKLQELQTTGLLQSQGLKKNTRTVSGQIQLPLDNLQELINLQEQTITVNNTSLLEHLTKLKPWRKGPWAINEITIESEWDSSIKYQRLQKYGPHVHGKTILDIGCGNGYYGYRMLGDGAKYVLGVDPSTLFWAQFSTFKTLEPTAPIDLLPIAGEPLYDLQLQFDIILSMGVLYHRRNPFDHLKLLRQCLAHNGELVLETLVIDGQDNQLLTPKKTYAGMPNVWGLPSVGLLRRWLQACDFRNIQCVSLSLTNFNEQQKTDWVNTHSLQDFLTQCGTKTKEGYPAPWRVIMRAQK